MEKIEVKMKPAGLTMDIDRQSMALAIKTWRLRQGLTQAQLGERWGCSRYTIIRAERAKPITWTVAYRIFARLADELKKEGGTI